MKRQPITSATLLSLAAALAGCGEGGSGNTLPEWVDVVALGGDTTNFTGNQSSFGFDTPAANLDDAGLETHLLGDGEFERQFIRAPNEDFPLIDGAGPAFNNNACLNCHARDGRANYTEAALKAPAGAWTKLGPEAGMFLRLSLETGGACTPVAENHYCAPVPVPGFGTQLFHRGVLGLRTDEGSDFSGLADVYVRFESSSVSYADGSTQTLFRPLFEIRNPWDAPGETPSTTPASRVLQADVLTSPRMSMPMFGLGLLEAIPEADLLALADPGDSNGDGISGRANYVFDAVKAARGEAEPVSLGRFGWKANTPSVAAQGSGAYRDDMGATNYVFPQESIAGTALYADYQSRNPQDDGQAASGFEVHEDVVKQVMFYSNTLAVPARRNVDDPQVRKGAQGFEAAGCTGCHTPTFTTATHPGVWGPSGVVAVPFVEGQTIHPFTDLLLHDMGEGLADGRGDFLANGQEWRTRPLWGIGLTQTVNPLAGFLHDGRARTLEEAILWHGGEAQAAREAFRTMSAEDRAALVAFLKSL